MCEEFGPRLSQDMQVQGGQGMLIAGIRVSNFAGPFLNSFQFQVTFLCERVRDDDQATW